MKFKIFDIGKLMTFEALTGDAQWDWACWAIIGITAILILGIVILIIAKCIVKRKFKITFNACGGKYNSVVKVRCGDKFTYPKDPKKHGYVFMGWFIDKKCKTRFASTELTSRKNVNVYAKWMKADEYTALNEQYIKAKNTEPTNTSLQNVTYKDPELERIEAEKLGYLAKKAEEERKTEEVKLQSIKEIEASKANDDARAKAEKDASEAKVALDNAIRERDEIIAQAKAEERTKCYSEMGSSVKNDNLSLLMLLCGANRSNGLNLDAELRKIKEEAKIEAKRELEEEIQRKADEEARINAMVEARIKDYNENKRKEEELANVAREKTDADNSEILLRLEEVEAKLTDIELEQPNSNNSEILARLDEIEKQLASTTTVATSIEKNEIVEEKNDEVTETTEITKIFDRLKAEMLCYVRSNDLNFGIEKDVPICSITEDSDKDVLELNVALSNLEEKGYNVTKGEKLPSAYEIHSEEDVSEGLELIEEAMSANGMMKSVPQVIYASSESERKDGFEFVINYDKEAENVNEYYALLCTYVSSFADVEGYEGEDLPLVKIFKDGETVLVYINYKSSELDTAEKFMTEQGYASLIKVSDTESCKSAMKFIENMMKDNGLIQYPAMTGFVEIGDDDGFAYTLKA